MKKTATIGCLLISERRKKPTKDPKAANTDCLGVVVIN
jgi:hypothetical protein